MPSTPPKVHAHVLRFCTVFRFTLHWVNHRNNELQAMARELLTCDEGLMHRSRRQNEPEAVFGLIKYDIPLQEVQISWQ